MENKNIYSLNQFKPVIFIIKMSSYDKTKWPKRSDKLVAVMMLKNERPRLEQTTLKSIKDYVSQMICYDTGSTDGTQDLLRTFCKDNDIRLDLKEGPFVNFSASRNVLLDYCDEVLTEKKFLLQLDAHDELQNGDKLVDYIKTFNGTFSGFYLTQRWYSGNAIDSYYNVRLVISHNKWRYKQVVHEYIMCEDLEKKIRPDSEVVYRLEGVYLYQDRTADNESSIKRFTRDKVMLYNEYVKDPTDSRVIFYLAQTCSCLGLLDEAYKYYIIRLKLQGFWEEIYQSYFRLGDISQTLKHTWEESMLWYFKAYQHSQRAEPLVKISEYYRDHNLTGENKPEWHTCFAYANLACQLIYPSNHILFVDKYCYTYKRWHLLGIAAYYVGRFKEGKEACMRAIETENKEIDRNNLKFYLNAELDVLISKKMPNLVSTSLFAKTVQDAEIRHQDEYDIKHDKQKVLNDAITMILIERREKGQLVPDNTISALKGPEHKQPVQAAETKTQPDVKPTTNNKSGNNKKKHKK